MQLEVEIASWKNGLLFKANFESAITDYYFIKLLYFWFFW